MNENIKFLNNIRGNSKINQYIVTAPLKEIRKLNLKHREVIQVKIIKNNKETNFITTLNINIRNGKEKRAIFYINRYSRKLLNLDYNDEVGVEIKRPLFENDRPNIIFKDDKIDLLCFLPTDIKVVIENDKLILWRDYSIPMEINRFIDISLAGKFLGLSFSEGQKCENTTGAYISICNKDVELHEYVIDFLKELSLFKLIKSYCYYNINKINGDQIKEISKKYENVYNINIKNVKINKSHGNYTFLTNLNSTLLGELLLNLQNNILNIENKLIDNDYKLLLENFIAKELSGDGSFVSTKHSDTITIGEKNPKLRIKLKNILDFLDLKSNIDDKRMLVRFDVTPIKKRLYLISISAFDGENREKLMNSINSSHTMFFNLQMKRLEKLIELKEFDNKTIRKIFSWSQEKATKWLNSMRNKGYIYPIRRDGYSTIYSTQNNETFKYYFEWKDKFNNLFPTILPAESYKNKIP
ncbi:MAG: hypothetical protein AABW45_00115 [Nanoarchaeota archaeon]